MIFEVMQSYRMEKINIANNSLLLVWKWNTCVTYFDVTDVPIQTLLTKPEIQNKTNI